MSPCVVSIRLSSNHLQIFTIFDDSCLMFHIYTNFALDFFSLTLVIIYNTDFRPRSYLHRISMSNSFIVCNEKFYASFFVVYTTTQFLSIVMTDDTHTYRQTLCEIWFGCPVSRTNETNVNSIANSTDSHSSQFNHINKQNNFNQHKFTKKFHTRILFCTTFNWQFGWSCSVLLLLLNGIFRDEEFYDACNITWNSKYSQYQN